MPRRKEELSIYGNLQTCGQGYKCLIAFVIQMEEISEVRPNTAMHPEFGIALEEAKDAGVEVLS